MMMESNINNPQNEQEGHMDIKDMLLTRKGSRRNCGDVVWNYADKCKHCAL